ncbi:hypothetical protein [Cupriavidus basilensis]|uniref:hypothetical protein n=1 Tax=Cupriavidus basilensis TaxID=68895 RepID=UPI0020A638EE|nr:hypothetical protein [Cupriavidus basilensis]MCP3017447.1 hypothetical protein [Cupriavidus basilensis]
MSQKYQVIVQASEQGVQVCMAEGPCRGALVGYAEQAQLKDATVLSDGRVVGHMVAMWGLELINENLDELSTLSLSLRGAFRLGRLRVTPEKQVRYRSLLVESTPSGCTMRAEA